MPAEPRLLAGRPPPDRSYDADVVILSHHRPRETVAAIRSAAAQTGLDHHVIVLDQGSAPSMLADLAEVIAVLAGVALYGLDRNLGVPGGRNIASSLGHGRAIVALDNDAVFATPDIAVRAAARLSADADLGAIGFRILASGGVHLDATSWGYPKSLRPQAAGRFAATTFVGCGHALARRCFESLGGYDSSLFFTWEEYEFARRAIAAGWRIEHHGDLAVIHAVSPEARVTWDGGRWFRFVRNRLLIAHDWHGPAGMIPRAALYASRGLAAGRLAETLGAIAEARRMARTRPRRHADAAVRRYIHARETAYRLPGPIRFISANASAAATVAPMAAPPAPSDRS